jgi:hypothetical protein
MTHLNPGAGSYVIARDNGDAALTGTVNETILATAIIRGNILGNNGWLSVETLWACANNANAKTGRIRLQTLANNVFLQSNMANNLGGYFQSLITNDHATNAQVGGNIGGGHGTAGAALPTDAVDTLQDFFILITGQLANAGDTLTLRHFSVVISPSD